MSEQEMNQNEAVEEATPLRVWQRGLPRRRFLQQAAAATGGAVALTVAPHLPAGAQGTPMTGSPVASPVATPGATPVASPAATPAVLTPTEQATLRAAIARLIPADDLGPGAVEAGVDVFINGALATADKATLPLYQKGLAALDQAAGGNFADADASKQDDLLTQAEGGKLVGADASFFPVLLEHTRQGMFGDPIYGGNQHFAGWDLIGYPGIKLVWSAEEQAVGTTVKPEHVSVAQYGGTPSE